MSHRVNRLCLVIAAAFFMLLAGCGGGGGLFSGTAPPADSVGQAKPGEGLKREVHYTYDYSAFKAADGLAVVPLDSSMQPVLTEQTNYACSITQQADGKVASVSCTGVSEPLFHLRYDPAVYQVSGIGVTNPYPEGTDFLSFADVVEPGVAVVYVIPVGGNPAARATGALATFLLQPPGTARKASQAPGDENVMTMALYCRGLTQPPALQCIGNIDIRLDGAFGDVTAPEKDAHLVGTELGNWAMDNCAHDASLTQFGQLYGWDSALGRSRYYLPMNLKWSERLVGDYDNNGTVTISDLTPIAQLWDGPVVIPWNTATPTKRAQSHTIDTMPVDQDFFSMMASQTWLTRYMAHIVESYYIYDPADVTINPPLEGTWDFTDPVVTASKNGVDGFWDGLVRDYKNWDSNMDGIPESTYTYPYLQGGTPTWSAPGDTLPLHYHMNDHIDGYQAWSMLHADAGNFNPALPPTSAVQIYLCDRVNYPDKPWNLSGTARYRRAVLQKALANPATSFNLGQASVAGQTYAYDIVLAPYAYNGAVRQYGPQTRLQNVMTAAPQNFGPQYHLPGDSMPTDNSAGRGIIGGNRNGCIVTIKHWDGDPIDKFHNWAPGPVRYTLYATNDPNPAVLWTNPTISWTETETERLAGGMFWHTNTFQPMEYGVDWEDMQTPVYAGIRMTDTNGNVIEYSYPGGNYGPNTTRIIFDVVENFGPQYIVNGDPQDYNDTPHTAKGITDADWISQISRLTVQYYDADQVLRNQGVLEYSNATVKYELYAYRSDTQPDPALVFATTPFKLWVENGADESGLPNDLRQKIYYNLSFPEPGTWWLGVRARLPQAAPGDTLEYVPVDTANLALHDVYIPPTDPPYFIEHSSPYTGAATAVDGSIIAWFPFDNAIQVMFKRAIDPPAFDPQELLTYYCFYSTRQFTWDETITPNFPNDLPPDISYVTVQRDYYSHQGPPFDTEAFSCLIQGLNPANDYYLYVSAKDNSAYNQRSLNTKVYGPAHARRVTSEAIDLGLTTSTSDVGEVVGDIMADDDRLYLLYAYDVNSVWARLRYEEVPDGIYANRITQNDIMSGSTFKPANGAPNGGQQLKLDFMRDGATGQPLMAQSYHQACISFHGPDTATLDGYDMCTSGIYGADQWFNAVQQVTPGNGAYVSALAGAITTYQYYSGGTPVSREVLPWAGAWWNLDIPPAQLYYRVGDSAFMWPRAVQQFVNEGYYFFSWDSPYGPDIVTRSLGLDVNQFFPSSGGLPGGSSGGPILPGANQNNTGQPVDDASKLDFLTSVVPQGNMLYVLTNSGADRDYYAGGSATEFVSNELWYTPDPTSGFFGPINLQSALPYLNLNPDSNIGPNSMEAVRSNLEGQQIVYVAYSNAGSNPTVDDDTGLRIAYATQYGTSSLSTFQSPDIKGVIDPEFRFVGNGIQNFHDQVDMHVKPNGRITDELFEQLGCAYVHQGNSLFMAETFNIGGDYEWDRVSVDPQSPIDEGRIRWAKLAYLYSEEEARAIPYVLYAIQLNPGSSTYAIRLWRLGGW